jgi:hypothetical protein
MSPHCALADKELAIEMLRTLCSEALDTTAVTSTDCHHLAQAYVDTAKNVIPFIEVH